MKNFGLGRGGKREKDNGKEKKKTKRRDTEDAEKKKQIPRFAPFAPQGKRNDS